jgi:hypothetical protein
MSVAEIPSAIPMSKPQPKELEQFMLEWYELL